MMRLSSSSAIFSLFVASIILGCDCFQDAGEERLSERAKVLMKFFNTEDIAINVNDKDLVDAYSQEVIDELLKWDRRESIYNKYTYASSLLFNEKINGMIYTVTKSEYPDEIESTLRALNLMVPDSITDPFLKESKDTLRKFSEIRHEPAKELLDKFRERLEDLDVRTSEAIGFLKGCYYHWIPLFELNSYIDAHAE